MGILIKNTYSYIPEHKIDNQYFESYLDTSDEWITKRTGIKSRYFSDKSVAEMAILCAKGLRFEPQKIKLILSCSFTDRQRMPSVSAGVANACGLLGAVRALDLNVACSGFVAGLDLAEHLLELGEQALVIGSEKISDFLDMQDRSTCILFGDAAGAVLVEKTPQPSPTSFGLVADKQNLALNAQEKIRMNGQEVFQFAVKTLKQNIRDFLVYQPDYIICHQANQRIIDHVSQALNLPAEKFYKNLQSVGNTSAASIPLCLDEMQKKIGFKSQTRLLLCGFGAGLSYYNKIVEINHDEF